MSKLMESMAAEEDFEPNQDSSFSEDEHLPRGGAAERPLTPGKCPRCPVGSGPERVGGWLEVPLGKQWAGAELPQGVGMCRGPEVGWGHGICGKLREAGLALV